MSTETTNAAPQQIAGFELLEKVADSGMGVSYKARQTCLDRIVTIRILAAHLAQNETFVAHFANEARAAAQLDHPNLVKVYDAGKADGHFFFAIEYVEGETVGQRIRRDGPMDERCAVDICLCVAQALQHAWDKAGLLHGDLKPENILIENGTNAVRIAGLGLGKSRRLRETDSGELRELFAMGTPSYVSPEKAMARQDIDFRADMYSLGATLYHMLTGGAPFEGLPAEQILGNHIEGYLPDPRGTRTGLTEQLMQVLERMLAKDPRNRYPNWTALAHDLQQIQGGHHIAMTPLTPGLSTLQRIQSPTPHVKVPQKSSFPKIAVAVTITLAALGMGWWYFANHPKDHAEVVATPLVQKPVDVQPVATAEPATQSPPSAEVADQEKAAKEAEAQRIQQEEQARKQAENDALMAAARPRYDAWRPAFEALLTKGDFAQALEMVSKAQQDPQFEPVKSRLDGDESLARLLARVRDTAWLNAPGQPYQIGAAAGTITKLDDTKLWVKLSLGEVAVTRTSVDSAKLATLALAKTPNDPELNLGAAMLLWYTGDKPLARTYLARATTLGATATFPLPAEEAAQSRSVPTPTPSAPVANEAASVDKTAATDAAPGSPKHVPQIDILVKKGLKRGYSGTDYDNQRDAMNFTVQVKNKEFRDDYKKLTATLYVYGVSTTTQMNQLLLKKSDNFDVAHGGAHEFDGGSLSLEYDDNYFAKFGVKYAGYVVVIRDESGAIVKSKSTNQSFVRKIEKLDQIQPNAYFDGNLETPGAVPRPNSF